MSHYKFKKYPGNFGQVDIAGNESLMPSDIYEYAKAFRSVYTRSMPMLKKIVDPSWATHQEIEQLYGKAQSIAVQIAISNELLLKTILFASTGHFSKEHNLKKLIAALDSRYQDIIKKYMRDNHLKDGKWNKVLDMSAQTFVTARYGFEGQDYTLDFRTLQLLNEALDDIYNNYLPDWTNLTKAEKESKETLRKEVDLIFDKDYQREQAKLLRLLRKVLK
ncbi:MAG TPA: hypothetical protein VGE13_04420 [Candidatus Saccharimonadales bacterium]